MSESIEFDPVDRVTVGAVGSPGQRVFLIQATQGERILTWIIEKGQGVSLAFGSYSLLTQIGEHEMIREVLGVGVLGSYSEEFAEAMQLSESDPEFRIDPSSMSMGYDEARQLVTISFFEMLREDEAREPATVRLWLTHRQLAALALQAMTVAAQGRPVCPMCGNVKEDGHTCPVSASNGHAAKG